MPPPLRAAARFGIAYRRFTEEDMAFVAALYSSTREEEVAQTNWPQELQQQFLAQQFHAQHVHYSNHYADAEWLIIERAGEPIGRLYLYEEDAKYHVIDISLVRASRGHGIGQAILKDVIDLAAQAVKAVEIHVEKNNPARRLYDRMGFTLVHEEGVYDLLRWSAPD